MKRIEILVVVALLVGPVWGKKPIVDKSNLNYGWMKTWQSHIAYGRVSHIVNTPNLLYGLADGSIFAVNKQDGELSYYSKLDGLNGSYIDQIIYDPHSRQLLIYYKDGLIDLMSDQGDIIPIADLSLKQLSTEKTAHSVLLNNGLVYVATDFGVLVVNIDKHEIADTYIMGNNGKEVAIEQVALSGDSIYALSSHYLYSANRKANLADYSNWQCTLLPFGTDSLSNIIYTDDALYVRRAGSLYTRTASGQWHQVSSPYPLTGLCADGKQLYALYEHGFGSLAADGTIDYTTTHCEVNEVIHSGNSFWLAAGGKGIIRQSGEGQDIYHPEGPAVNIPYRMHIANRKLYVVPGGRWAEEMHRPAYVMIYDGKTWTNITAAELESTTQYAAQDFMNVAVDPLNPEHYFVTAYGMGLYEFYGTQLRKHYNHKNSALVSAAPGPNEMFYVRTDGAVFDDNGNLYLINTSPLANNLHVITPEDVVRAHERDSSGWFTTNFVSNGERAVTNTPGEIIIDNRNPNIKWIPSLRERTGLICFDDNGTPTRSSDDKSMFRNEWVDQNGNVIKPTYIYAVAQDLNGALWVAMEVGVFRIPATVDFFKSNACERIIIPRNDGTNLADYLLGTEKINAIAVDGMNRVWFGTNSGLYLMQDGTIGGSETMITAEHFTTENSPLPSNEIISLAIEPHSGMVYIGTGEGLMSYQSDAADGEETFSSAYAYPNPVRPDYVGLITIAGLMENTAVTIVDGGGNVVCKTNSNGGIATWDGKNGHGQRVASGIYSALCNTNDGAHHTVVKILIIN